MNRLRARSALCVLAFVAVVGATLGLDVYGASAQEPAPELNVTTSFNPPAATIGDVVTLDVRVQHSPEVVVTVDRPTLQGGEVLGDAQPMSAAQADGSVVTSYAFRYQLFTRGGEGGELGVSQLSVHWLREDGTNGVATTGGPVLTIIPVRQPADLELRPLKPQLSIPGAPPAWVTPVAIGAAVVLVLALAVLGVLWWRARRTVDAPPAPSMSAEAQARARLDALRHGRLENDEAFQAYYGTLAHTVREYLGERFAFNASALTASELEERMTSHGVDRWQARLVGGLLERCDRAVYAREYPDPASADHDLTVAYEIVELSRPRYPGAEVLEDGAEPAVSP